MPRANNPTLGNIRCECGLMADVCQAKRGKGRFLYTRCADCGTDQRTGKVQQTRLYYASKWREGVEVVRPPNVPEQQPEEPAPVQVIEPKAEPEPQPKKEPDAEPKKNGNKGGWGLLVAGLAAVVLLPFKGGM